MDLLRKGLEEGQTSLPPKGVLQTCNVFGLRAFFAPTDFESHFLTFVQFDTAVTAVVYLTKVYKYVIAAVFRSDKSKTFFTVEPFDGSVYESCHCNSLFVVVENIKWSVFKEWIVP